MQIKKEEIFNAILDEAEKEFLEKGFKHASVRKIVKAAGTTIGNFYNYFKSKEALFESFVLTEYEFFQNFFVHHEEIEQPDFLLDIADISSWRGFLQDAMMSMLPSFSHRFVILIECSEGTKYADSRKVLMDFMKNHFMEHLSRFHPNKPNDYLGELVAEQILNGILHILKKHKCENTRRELLTDYILLYMIGAMGLIGKECETVK